MCIIPASMRYRGSRTNRYSALATCNPKRISTLVSLDRRLARMGNRKVSRSLVIDGRGCMHASTDRCMQKFVLKYPKDRKIENSV